MLKKYSLETTGSMKQTLSFIGMWLSKICNPCWKKKLAWGWTFCQTNLALSPNSLWCFEVFCMHWILVMIFIDFIEIGSHSWKTSYIIYTVWFCFYNWIYTNNCLQSVIKFYWQLNRFLFSIAASVLNFASCLWKTCQARSTAAIRFWQLRHWNLHQAG